MSPRVVIHGDEKAVGVLPQCHATVVGGFHQALMPASPRACSKFWRSRPTARLSRRSTEASRFWVGLDSYNDGGTDQQLHLPRISQPRLPSCVAVPKILYQRSAMLFLSSFSSDYLKMVYTVTVWCKAYRPDYICSQLPEFFGGLCTCSNQGGCLRSNKGLWSDPLIMKIVHSIESSALRYIVQVSDIEETITGSVRLCALKLSDDRSLPVDKSPINDITLLEMYQGSTTHGKIHR